MPHVSLINPAVMQCRIYGLYKMILRENYAKAIIVTKITLREMNMALEVDMHREEFKYMERRMHYLLNYLALKKYNDAHNTVRDMHYHLTFQTDAEM
jgi:hypothetical protein